MRFVTLVSTPFERVAVELYEAVDSQFKQQLVAGGGKRENA